MTNNHPITPPPELFAEWLAEAKRLHPKESLGFISGQIAQLAYRSGADQELEACGKYLEQCAAWEPEDVTELYDYRRPRPTPPSLKEQALAELELLRGDANAYGLGFDAPAIRRALESLPD